MKKDFREKIATSLWVSFFFGLTLFFFGPTHLYFTNILQFSSSFHEICPIFVTLSLFCVLLLATSLIFLKYPIYQKATSLLFVLSFLLWLQGNILVWHYGPLDGREIDWDANKFYGSIGTAIWIVLIILAFIFAANVLRIAQRASFAFILIQSISTLIVVFQAPDASHLYKESLTEEESIFKFSSEKNVIILILDSFQGDIFQEIINESSDYKKIFDGFTYYRNALGGYPITHASVPLILAGRFYENSIPIEAFTKKALSSNSLPKILTQNNYQVDLIGHEDNQYSLYVDETIASNRVHMRHMLRENIYFEDAALLFILTSFKALPHHMKKYVYRKRSWLSIISALDRVSRRFPAGYHRDDIEFIKKMADQAQLGNNRYTFKYIHLWLPHFPCRINERLEYEESELNRDNYKKQAKGSLELAIILLKKLKVLGIYDKTMLFVLGDHGFGQKIDVGSSGYTENNSYKFSMIDVIKGRGLPLYLVKPFMSTGELKISDAPVSLSDVAHTIISELKVEAEIPGTSIFEIKDSDVRNRRFMYYEWTEGLYGKKKHLPDMKEYIVSGFSWLDASWHPTYRVFTFDGIRYVPPQAYRYGTSIEFGEDGNSLDYQGIGWSYPGKGFTRTNEKSASLTMRIGKPASDIELKATYKPFIVPDKVNMQRVKVFVNGQILGEWVDTEAEFQQHSVIIPSSLIASDIVDITFELPDAIAPARLGMGRNKRLLSISMRSIVLTELVAGSEN